DHPEQSPIPAGQAPGRPCDPRDLHLSASSGRRAGSGPDPGQERIPVPRPSHARLDERRQVLHPASGHWRSDACLGCRKSRSVQPPGLCRRRLRQRRPGGTGLFPRRAERLLQSRPETGAVTALPFRPGHDRDDRLLRPAGCRRAARRRNRGDLRGGRCGRQHRRADCQAQGLPGGRDCRRCREVQIPDRRAGLRRGHRLQERGRWRRPETRMSERRGCVFRQRRGRYSRRGAHPPELQGTRGDLRRHQPVQQQGSGERPGQLSGAAGQPRAHGRFRGDGLRQSLRRRRTGNGRLDRQGPAQEQGRYRRRPGDLSGDADETVQRGELRQAGVEGL
ncbi:Putative NADP-dependent oxidoreductase PA1648, partial [Pseudomonas sp. FEN]